MIKYWLISNVLSQSECNEIITQCQMTKLSKNKISKNDRNEYNDNVRKSIDY